MLEILHKKHNYRFIIIFSLLLNIAIVYAIDNQDPYEILIRHYNAIGGIERLDNINTLYTEDTFKFRNFGQETAYKTWTQGKQKIREEYYYPNDTAIYADNGRFKWSLEYGEFTIETDSIKRIERFLDSLMDNYEHLNRDSKYFTIKFEGLEAVGDMQCYKLKMTNTLSKNTRIYYYDTLSYYNVKWIDSTQGKVFTAIMSDFAEVDGIIFPFSTEVYMEPEDVTAIYRINKIELNVPIDSMIFEPPLEAYK